MKSFFAAIVIIVSSVAGLTGCMHHYSSLFSVNALIDAQCLTQPLFLEDCDPKSQPLHCRKVSIYQKTGCERLQVKREPAEDNKVDRD